MSGIETKRLLLRPPMLNDLDDLLAIARDPAVLRVLGADCAAAEGLRTLLKRESAACVRDGIGLHSVVDPREGHVVGLCGLQRRDVRGVESVVVTCLIDPQRRREGLATETVEALLAHAAKFLEVGAPRALIEPANTAGVTLAARLGWSRVDGTTMDGRIVDVFAPP